MKLAKIEIGSIRVFFSIILMSHQLINRLRVTAVNVFFYRAITLRISVATLGHPRPYRLSDWCTSKFFFGKYFTFFRS